MLVPFPQSRIRFCNDKPILNNRKYVLYWMQANRRLASNHSLDYAVRLAKELGKELVIYEGLRKDYPWNSKRLHQFILEGMIDNAKEAERISANYWSYVETPKNPAQGLLKKIAENAVSIITDDFPCFIIPEQIEKLSCKVDCQVIAIDGNGIIPLSEYGNFASAARILRPRIHKLFANHYLLKAKPSYKKSELANLNHGSSAPFPKFEAASSEISQVLSEISFSNNVEPVLGTKGGRIQALKFLKEFLHHKITNYETLRSKPDHPSQVAVSNLSAYLHFGHISAEEIITAVLDWSEEIYTKGKSSCWTPERINIDFKGKRENFYSPVSSANSYLDELITWRDTGYQMFWHKKEFRKNTEILPDWIKANFARHKKDKREYKYNKEEWSNSKTHDPIWNAAQTELVHTGRMHNYMRMLWGKKIIEWSPSIEEAFDLLEEFNNLYAYDGRNPNSYTGILWCFGLFDRPWFPERNVLGNVRYMSSDSTRKKFKLAAYLDYIDSLTNSQGSLF
ncbi:MAG: deoxyribodipyrimidine photolyase [Leptospiraceae bacterium]|nr:deoxyribodipyrimidine photolyase [Leptospiraceae bacterium]